jgi:hypothetical protein
LNLPLVTLSCRSRLPSCFALAPVEKVYAYYQTGGIPYRPECGNAVDDIEFIGGIQTPEALRTAAALNDEPIDSPQCIGADAINAF